MFFKLFVINDGIIEAQPFISNTKLQTQIRVICNNNHIVIYQIPKVVLLNFSNYAFIDIIV